MFGKTLPRYDGYLQLHDNHTMWKLDNPTLDEKTAENLYTELVNEAVDVFQERTGEELFLFGRSGRHVCVEDTPENSRRYQWLKKTALNLEQWVIKEFNSSTPETM